jgi:hypothetical protein
MERVVYRVGALRGAASARAYTRLSLRIVAVEPGIFAAALTTYRRIVVSTKQAILG